MVRVRPGAARGRSAPLHPNGAGFLDLSPRLRHSIGAMIAVRLATLLLAAALLAPGAARAQASGACPGLFLRGQPPTLLNPRLSNRATPLCNDAFAVLASGVTRGPLWSAEHLTAASLALARQTPREDAFHPDERLAPSDRAELADYVRSGFDRGHMSPSGDMPGPQAQAQSFALSNMVPQTAALNRGVWEGIESAVRALATQDGELFVVTGPAFRGRRLRSIGPDGVLVPSATWKAVYDPRTGASGVYVCPNTARPRCGTVSVAELGRQVGVDPFPALPAAAKAVAAALPPPEPSHYGAGRRERERMR